MLKKIVEKNYKWIIIFLCLIIVIMMLEDIFENEQLKIDVFIYKLVVLNLRNQQLTALMKIVTNLASAYVLIAIAVASILFIKNKIIGISITSNLVIVTLLNQLLKRIIQRPRPEGYRLITENGYSFPSGHSMVSMAFYGFIIYLIWKLVKNKKIKYLETGILGIFIFLIGFSRIYLGVHYASDVVGGFAISIAYLIMFTNIIKPKLQNKKEIKMINKNKFENIKKKIKN
ncbi:MAG: phosphatase PAP2 family protein [Clostridia bacterium]